MKRLPFIILILFLLCACGGESVSDRDANDTEYSDGISEPDDPPNVHENWYHPPVSATWQWQLSGEVNTAYDVEIYDIDLFDTSEVLIRDLQAAGKKVICYFSAGSYEEWRSDANLFKAADLGNNLDGWPGERWLDIRSTEVESIMKQRLDLAAEKGCDGVEPDNVDGYTNDSGFDFTGADQIAYNRMLAREAHSRGLAIGLKNNVEQISYLVDSFDFAVNEQCFQYNECDLLVPFIAQGKAVLNAEYHRIYLDDTIARETLCRAVVAQQFSTLILPLALDDTYRYSCD